MARSTTREAGPLPQKSRRRLMHSANGEQQTQDGHGPDPWIFVNCWEDAAVSTSSAAAGLTRQGGKTSLRSRLVSHFGGREQGTITRSTSANETSKAHDEEDDVAIPTPIHATMPWKIVAPDGRSRNIHTPIHGFEHLFEDTNCFQEAPSTGGRPRSAVEIAGQPQHAQAPGTPQHTSAFGGTQQLRSKHLHEIKVPSKKTTVLMSTTRNVLKRTRSVAQGLAQSPNEREAINEDNNTNTNEGDEKADKELVVVTETSKTFHVGDVDALKIFFRQRIDELTMKPVRGMVTTWLKQLEPKRKGGYGPYHKLLPSQAPEDATPPWWPRTVPYIEPAHLDKDGLLTLAVDIMLQHRDIPIDEFKRQQSWTHKLCQVAHFEIEMTPQEHYSSSRNPAFSKLMKERAENHILPSLFDVSQSYEDHVNQYDLWTYRNIKDAPRGKSITWQVIPRPPKQISRAKRPRSVPRPKVKREGFIIEALVESSGDETEADDTMYRLAEQIMRNKEAKEARRKAKATAESTPLTTQTPSANRASPERTVEAPSPTVADDDSAPATPQAKAQHLQDPNTDDAKPVVSSSFDQSMDHLRLQDDTKRGSFVSHELQAQTAHQSGRSSQQPSQIHALPTDGVTSPSQRNEDNVKGGVFIVSADPVQEVRPDTQVMDELMHYHTPPAVYTNPGPRNDQNDVKGRLPTGSTSQDLQAHDELQMLGERIDYQGAQPSFVNNPYPSPQGTGPFPSQQGSPFTHFAPHNFIDPTQLSMFSSMPLQMGHYHDHNMASHNMHMTYQYGQNGMFNPMDVNMSGAPSPSTATPFNGLPYDYSGLQH